MILDYKIVFLSNFSDFLFGSFSFDEQTALNLLSDFGEVDLILTLAKARGMVVDALQCLVKAEAFTRITFSSLNDLVHRGFSAHLIQCGRGEIGIFQIACGMLSKTVYLLSQFFIYFC